MRKKIINVLSVVMFVCMLLPKNVYAATGGGSVTVGIGSVYVTGVSGVHRTGDYSYVSVKANSVYPTEDKKDNYTTCKVRLYQNDSTSTAISDEYTVKEGTGYTDVGINQGHLSLHWLNICFAGNDPRYGAVIDFSYDSH